METAFQYQCQYNLSNKIEKEYYQESMSTIFPIDNSPMSISPVNSIFSEDSAIDMNFSSPESSINVSSPESSQNQFPMENGSPSRSLPDSDDRTQTRRLKNRESAARSRQKIKNRLISLEQSMHQMENKLDALVNEKHSHINELERLETQILGIGWKFSNFDISKSELWNTMPESTRAMDRKLEIVQDNNFRK